MNNVPVVILGAGPAGLTAGYELLQQGMHTIILEKTDKVGGIARTENYKGYLFDIGGHRFFTKNAGINQLWHDMLGQQFLTVPRMSRIHYGNHFFNYPLEFWDAFSNLGVVQSALILLSYLKAQLAPYPAETSFEQWVSNRFGRRLYETFFKTYTEKIWGMPCHQIGADWAAQRIKGLSLITAVSNALLGGQFSKTLIARFNYPEKGPGMMFERFEEAIHSQGGEVRRECKVVEVRHDGGAICGVRFLQKGKPVDLKTGCVISGVPLPNLINMLHPAVPHEVSRAANGLTYRAFLIVILIIDQADLFPDQWIYIHNPSVRVGRIQNFKNWSPAMVPDSQKTSIGMEYFCNEGDDLWTMADEGLGLLASRELSQLGLARSKDIVDSCVLRQPKAYPIYDDGYTDRVRVIKDFLNDIENLHTIGRNGMHRYNNMDHSMLTGVLAARNALGERHELWEINEDKEYLEEERPPDVSERLRENILGQTFARMDKLAFAIATGSVCGLLLFLATTWLVLKDGPVVGPNLQLLSQFFVGYTVTMTGAFIAFGYSFFWGFLLGWLVAYLRNLFLAGFAYWARKRAELLSLKDFFDHL